MFFFFAVVVHGAAVDHEEVGEDPRNSSQDDIQDQLDSQDMDQGPQDIGQASVDNGDEDFDDVVPNNNSSGTLYLMLKHSYKF